MTVWCPCFHLISPGQGYSLGTCAQDQALLRVSSASPSSDFDQRSSEEIYGLRTAYISGTFRLHSLTRSSRVVGSVVELRCCLSVVVPFPSLLLAVICSERCYLNVFGRLAHCATRASIGSHCSCFDLKHALFRHIVSFASLTGGSTVKTHYRATSGSSPLLVRSLSF